ncbi:Inactive serine/threonine-protein kinase TEX14, partial [Nestor notabilis]
GVFVDAVNSMGQTSLFTAALLGLGKIVDILLDYGSDANHRCYDGSTPVHAAAFSGNQWILSRLLDEGGDLRVHDKNGKKPQCWAMSADKETSAQILKFIQRCTSHMQAAIQNFPSDLLRKISSSKALVNNPSRFGSLVQGNVDSPLGRFLKGGANAARNIYSFGFGKVTCSGVARSFGYALVVFQFYFAGSGHLEYLASLLIIGEKDLVQADDEAAFSYRVGPYMIMTNLMWGGSRVTVKELGSEPHQNYSKLRFADLLVAEQEHSSKLRHPHLLQLMAVCLSSDLEKTRLVYERVNLGSLYSILHERRTEFPVLHMEIILHVLLQIIDALRFLHSRGFIHRSVTSYAIQIVSSGEAKLCNLEYMIESKDGGEHSDLTRIPVPIQLYKWCSPEVILEKVVTVKSDIYSFCAVLQEALTETSPWKGCEDSVIKQLVISGQQLEADVRLPVPYYDIVKSGLEPKQKNRSMNLQDIQYILKNDLKDLLKSQTGNADETPKAQRPVGFADVNICLVSAFNSQKKTQVFQGKEITKADSSTSPIYSAFPEEKSALVPQEASTNLHAVAQDENQDVASELEMTPSLSDVDDSLCSFEINEIFASFPEPHKDFLEEGARLGQALKDEKRQQKEEEKATFKDLTASPGVPCEEKPVYEEDSLSELDTEYSTEAQESTNEASDLAQVRDAGRLVSNLSRTEQHISKCVLSVKISQSMVQQIAESLCRLEEKLDKSETTKNQNKLLQEVRMNQLSEQNFQGHWNRSDDTSQNTDNPFSGVNTFSWKAVGPPSRNYVPPGITCQAQGALGGGGFQAVSKTAKPMEVLQNEKWKCFHEMSNSKNENNCHDLTFTVVKKQDDLVSLDHQNLFPCLSVRSKTKSNLQCQRGGDSRSAASGIEEERWSYPKSRAEIYSTKISEERMMQSEWRTEVKQMARRAASGRLELYSPYPTNECTSESEAESINEAFQHVTVRVQKSQDQQRYRWQSGDNVEPQDLVSENRSESEESDLESAFRSSGGRSSQSPSQDEKAETGITILKNSVLPQQVENVSRGHSRELPSSFNSCSDVSEEFFTPDYFLPSTAQVSSELEIKITEKTGMNVEVTAAFTVLSVLCSLPSTGGTELSVSKVGSKSQEITQAECQEKDVSVTDIHNLSNIPYEQESCYRDVDCKTPRVSHAPRSFSTPLSSEEKNPIATEKYKHCHEVASDSSFCGSQEISTALREGRSTEIPSVASGVCSSALNQPVSLEKKSALCQPFKTPFKNYFSIKQMQDKQHRTLSQASNHFTDELPPPAQELLDEIEYLKQQDSSAQNFEENGSYDYGLQINVPDQIQMEDRESKKESERNEEGDHSLWTKESFNLSEETERAHSTLDGILERMIRAVPGHEEIQEQ